VFLRGILSARGRHEAVDDIYYISNGRDGRNSKMIIFSKLIWREKG
jgi:hypothetical protein